MQAAHPLSALDALEGLRVVQVIPTLTIGGLERVAVTLTLGFADRVDRVVVCSQGGDAFEAPLREADIPIEWIPRPRPELRHLLRSALPLARVLRRERPDLVHAHNPAAGAAAAVARLLARRPEIAIVASYQGVESARLPRAAEVLRRSADLVVAIGPATTTDLREAGVPASQLVTIYNAVDGSPSRSPDDVRREFGLKDVELVVNVGRYAEQKNQALLIDALAELAPRRPRLRALIVGDGPLEEELRARVEARGLGDVVRVTGPRLDAIDIIAAADAFALSSGWEPLGIVLLEAMSVGCPVAATAVGGVPDFVRHEETGLLVRPGDAPALAAAIERLLDDSALRRRMAEAARELVRRKFSKEVMLERYAAAYVSAVERRRAGSALVAQLQ